MSNYRKTMTEALREMYPLNEGTIDKVKEIASKKQAMKIDGVMVDSFTASAISQIYDKVNDAHKKKMEKLPITKLANLAFTQNAIDEAFVMIDQINKVDSRSYNGNYFAAFALEALNKRSEAIKYRESLNELDPWNNSSLIELIKNYLSVGNKASAEGIAALIKQNYPGSQSDIDASALLVG